MTKLEDVIQRGTTAAKPAAGTAGRLYYDTDLGLLQRDSGAAWETVGTTAVGGSGWPYPADGRLTLETGVPISISDQTAKTTLYYALYTGNTIALYDGASDWDLVTFAELSLDISGYTANKNYDIFCYNDSGTATLEGLIWTNDSTRATALTRQSGVLVKTGATTRRFLGTIRITAVTGQCEDSYTARYVSNMYNRVMRPFRLIYTQWNGTTSGYTPAAYNSNTTVGQGRVAFVACDTLGFTFTATESATHSNTDWFGFGLVLDAVTQSKVPYSTITASGERHIMTDTLSDIVAAGYHYIQKLFFAAATVTFNGLSGTFYNRGMVSG